MAYTKQIWIDRQGTDLNRFTKANETLTSVELTNNPTTITQAGTPFSKTRMDYMEEGIRTGHVIGTPLSDLSRVFRLNGNGIPIFPDNLAGRLYWHDKDWTVTTGWTGGAGVTLSIENSSLKVVSTAGNTSTAFISSATYQNKLVRVIIRCSTELTSIYTVTGSSAFTPMRVTKIGADKYVADIYWSRTGSDNLVIVPNYPATAALTWYLETISIGSGLFDTPVYDKACCNRFVNNGVFAVPSLRGQGMLFQGAQYLQADNAVVGTTGTLYGKFSTSNVTQTSRLLDNSNDSGYTGVRVVQSSAALIFAISSASASQAITLIPTMTANTVYSYKIAISASNVVWSINGGAETTTALTLTPVISATNMRIGANSNTTPGAFFNGVVYDIGSDNRLWSVDDGLRYYVGDDAVDSQQKSATGTPHAIAVFSSDGKLHATATLADSATSAGTATEVSNIGDTFIPELKFNGNNVGMTYDQRFGAWKRVGNCVFIRGFISVSNIGSSTGDASITGFPFSTSIYLSTHMINVTYDYVSYSGIPFGELSEADQRIYLKTETASQLSANLTASSFGNNSNISFSGFYFID